MQYRIVIIWFFALLLLAACGGGDELKAESGPLPEGDLAAGEKTYSQLCVACHGPGGVGVEGLGKSITTSEFVANSSDDELFAFIIEGRDITHPENSTGIAMPPKGGNPGLKTQDIANVVAYMRSIQE